MGSIPFPAPAPATSEDAVSDTSSHLLPETPSHAGIRAFAGTGALLCWFYHLSLFIVGEQEANRSVTNSSHVLTHRRAGYSGSIPGGKSHTAPACSPGRANLFGSLQHPPLLWPSLGSCAEKSPVIPWRYSKGGRTARKSPRRP